MTVCADILFFFYCDFSHHCELAPSDLRPCCSQDVTSHAMKGKKKKVKSVTSFSMNVIALQRNVMLVFGLKVILMRI